MNVQDQWCDAVDAVMAETGIQSRADAAEIARRRYPDLAAKARSAAMSIGRGSASMTGSPGIGPAVGGNPEAHLEALAKRLAAERRITFAQAYVAALNENPALYIAYLRQKEAEVRASLEARRG